MKSASPTTFEDLATVPAELGLQLGRPVLVLVGGAANMTDAEVLALESVFREGIARTVEELGGVIVDGGTDTGVMGLIGRARSELRASFPLVGVFPDALVDGDEVREEPNHTHLVRVPGGLWGAESLWLVRLAKEVSADAPVVVVVAKGGYVTAGDVRAARAEGLPVMVLRGSGGEADRLAAAPPAGDEGGFTTVESEPTAVANAIRALLGGGIVMGDGYDVASEVETVVEAPGLTSEQRAYLRTRWLDQVEWMNSKATRSQRRYLWLRGIGLVGSAGVSVLLAIDLTCSVGWLRYVSLAAAIVVGLAVGFEELFHFGEKWRHYRRNAELLKSEGLLFGYRVGPYAAFPDRGGSFPAFVERVESLIAEDVSAYFERIAVPQSGKPPAVGAV